MKERTIDLYNGDCLDKLKSLPDNSVDLFFTSPPYADRRKNTYGGIPEKDYIKWLTPIAIEIKRVIKPTGSFFLNIKAHCDKGERVLYVMKLIIHLKEELGFRFTDEFTWTKNGVPGKFNGRFKNAFEPVYHFTIEKGFKHFPYEVAQPAKEESLKRYKRKACGETKNGSGFAGMRKEITSNMALPSNHLNLVQKSNQFTAQSKHSAVFPEELPEFFIKAFSEEGDVVCDPFLGSGTTGVVAKRLNRNFIGMEMDKGHYEDACVRIKDTLNK